jgi:hypothetical protein
MRLNRDARCSSAKPSSTGAASGHRKKPIAISAISAIDAMRQRREPGYTKP